MVAEKHVAGSEFGELQRAKQRYGITYRKTLARVIEQNTGVDVQPNVFESKPSRPGEPEVHRAARPGGPPSSTRGHQACLCTGSPPEAPGQPV